MGSYSGRSHHEYLQDQNFHPLPQSQSHSQLHRHTYPQPQPHHHSLLQPHDLHEAIQREIEKQRIREEIMISEIARRRVLEAEVRRELMMERELALRRGDNGFPFGTSSGIGYDPTMRFPLLGMRIEERSLEEKVAMPHKEERHNGRHGNGELETLPFQRYSTEPRISEVKPVSEGKKEKDKIIFLEKPKEYVPGEKRKAATSPAVDDSELLTAAVSRKKAKEEWSCALCQVSATSEQALNDHVQGRKHKSKEASLRAHRAGKNYTIGLFPKKAPMSIKVVGTKSLCSEEGEKSATQSLHPSKMGETSSRKNNVPLFNGNRKLNKLKNKQSEVNEMRKDGNSKKKEYRFWCEMCQVGAHSRKVLNAHMKGKKHLRRVVYLNGVAPNSLRKKTIVQDDDTKKAAGNGNNITVENDGQSVDAVRSGHNKTIDAAKADDDKALDAAKTEGNGAMRVAKPDTNEDNDFVEQEYNEDMEAAKPEDKDNNSVEPEYTEAMIVAKPDDYEANDTYLPEYNMAVDAAEPDDEKADDAVELELSEAVDAAKPDDNEADNEVEPKADELIDS